VHTDERYGLRVYRFDRLPADRVDALVSTRKGGVSKPPYASLNLGLRVHDSDDDVVANRRRLFETYGLPLDRSAWCNQPHADGVAVVTDDEMPVRPDGRRDRGAYTEDNVIAGADALVTNLVGVPLCVTLADCVPVVLYDAEHHTAGVVHAGWRGMVKRIVSQAVATMRDCFGSDPASLAAAIGPAIAAEAFEVGPEVVDAARRAYGDAPVLRDARDGKAHFDLWKASLVDLELAGVPRDGVELAGISTVAALDEFYSHRVEGETGRVVTAVTLR
jgi:YfiH family protein